ncbi:MAG: hypothetical protein WDN00_08120 [Limisphaerales bacterium]
MIYTFAGTARTAGKTLPVIWYDGESRPPAEVIALIEGEEVPHAGSIFIGTEGVLLLPHFNLPALFPKVKFQDFKLPKVPGAKHWEQFVNACRGEGKNHGGLCLRRTADRGHFAWRHRRAFPAYRTEMEQLEDEV